MTVAVQAEWAFIRATCVALGALAIGIPVSCRMVPSIEVALRSRYMAVKQG